MEAKVSKSFLWDKAMMIMETKHKLLFLMG